MHINRQAPLLLLLREFVSPPDHTQTQNHTHTHTHISTFFSSTPDKEKLNMSDNVRKSFPDQAKEKLQPDSSKSSVDKAKESVTNTADSPPPLSLSLSQLPLGPGTYIDS